MIRVFHFRLNQKVLGQRHVKVISLEAGANRTEYINQAP